MKMGLYIPCSPKTGEQSVVKILDQLEDEGFRIDNIMDYTEAEQDGIFLEAGSLLLDRANEKHIVRFLLELMKNCL
jgi:hypothetical protein